MGKSLKFIFVGLPPKATFVDMHLTETLQRSLALKDINCLVFMIPHEGKQQVLNNLFKGTGKNHQVVEGIKVSATMSPDTLLYSWGNSRQGKLGISNNYFTELGDGDQHTQFFCDDEVLCTESVPELGEQITQEEIEM